VHLALALLGHARAPDEHLREVHFSQRERTRPEGISHADHLALEHALVELKQGALAELSCVHLGLAQAVPAGVQGLAAV
jgi:hypothetical protein